MNNNVGLDIGTSTIKAVEMISDKRSAAVVNNAYTLPTSSEAFQEDLIYDCGELSEQVAKVIKTGGFANNAINLAIKGSNVIVKRARIPFLTKQQLENDMRYIADQYMKVDIEEYAVDYAFLDVDVSTALASVAFAAIRRSFLTDYISVLESAQLKPSIISAEAFALCDLYSHLKLPTDQVSLIAHIGEATSLLIFLNKGIFSYQESSQSAGGYCTGLIKSLANIPADKAELVKISPDAFPEGDAVKKIISENYIPDCIGAIEQTISNYRMLCYAPPTHIYLSGGGATIFGLESALQEQLEVGVSVMDPSSGVEIRSSAAKQIMDLKPAVLNVAIGMALR